MKKSQILRGALLAPALLPAVALAQGGEKPMNILYIMSDDHAYQALSAYDGALTNTPNIDRIARDGVRFTNSFVANSISGPSRACMLTGKHSHVNGYTMNSHSRFDSSQQTYPKLLQKAGYQTAVIGKWHIPTLPTGFDHYDILIGQGHYYSPDFITDGVKRKSEGYSTDITTDLALKWLDEDRDKSKPFCLLLHHKAPHRTWMPNVDDLGMFDEVKFPIPETLHDDYEGREAAGLQEMNINVDMDLSADLKMIGKGIEAPKLKNAKKDLSRMTPDQRAKWDAYYAKRLEEYKKLNLSGKELMEWKYQQYMEDYCTVIANLDRNIGRVLDYLEEQGLDENTLVVYTADQGFYTGEHGWFDKRFMYEETFRTPLLMHLPGGKRGDIKALVQNIDYAPTFLELAGVKVPYDIQGESFLPMLKGEKMKDWRRSLYYHYYDYPSVHAVRRHYGVRTERYKLIRFYRDLDCWELYDLKKDPTEMHNIYGEKGTEKITAKLKVELERLRARYNAVEQ